MSKKSNYFGRRKDRKTAAHKNYLPLVLRLGRRLPPGVHHITVEHDADCPTLAGGNACTCSPFVRTGMPDSMKDNAVN